MFADADYDHRHLNDWSTHDGQTIFSEKYLLGNDAELSWELARIGSHVLFVTEDNACNRYLHLYNYATGEHHDLTHRLAPDARPSAPVAQFGRFYFAATDPLLGRELHYLELDGLDPAPGTVRFDADGNSTFDSTDPSFAGQRISLTSNEERRTVFTDSAGTYTSYLLTDTTNRVQVLTDDCHETVGPAAIDYVANSGNALPDFLLRPIDDQINVSAFATSGPTRCGFTVPFWFQATNTGCEDDDLLVRLELDHGISVVSSDPVPATSNGSVLEWRFDDVATGAGHQIEQQLIMPDEFRAGEQIPCLLIVSSATDPTVVDTFDYTFTLRCAIDPNDKLVHPARSEPTNSNYTQADETLTYTIRFQNTGNDTAITVRLEDKLSPYLDFSTFKPIGGSHPHRVELSEVGQLTITYDNILLVDSLTNEPESHGYFAYTIQAHPDALDLQVTNTAGIYFDFNQPIITNTTLNTVVEFLDEDQDRY